MPAKPSNAGAQDLFEPVQRQLSCRVEIDEVAEDLAAAFDYTFNGELTFSAPALPALPADFGIGLIGESCI